MEGGETVLPLPCLHPSAALLHPVRIWLRRDVGCNPSIRKEQLLLHLPRILRSPTSWVWEKLRDTTPPAPLLSGTVFCIVREIWGGRKNG